MKNLKQKQKPKSKSISSFNAGHYSLPILAAKAYSNSEGILKNQLFNFIYFEKPTI